MFPASCTSGGDLRNQLLVLVFQAIIGWNAYSCFPFKKYFIRVEMEEVPDGDGLSFADNSICLGGLGPQNCT